MIKLHQPVIAKPREGLNIRKEDGTYLPAEGDTVIHSSYWARRDNDGDVTLSEVEPETTSEIKATKK
jgi:hypothetical protein